jgi:hypothetical protein
MKKLSLRFPWSPRTMNFIRELEERFFPPGTSLNKNFQLNVTHDAVHIVVPDTPKNRSAISVLAHKYGILPQPPLIKFDEYMDLFYQGKIHEMRNKICDEVFNYVKKHFELKNHPTIIQVFCNEEIWKQLAEKWGKKFFLDRTMATVAYNCTFDPTTGVVHPKQGSHLILLNSKAFNKLSPQDQVFNYALTFFHELVHLSGVKDDIKVHMLEFKFSKEFLGIYHSKQYKMEKYKELMDFFYTPVN